MSNKMYCCPHCDYKAKHNWQALQKHIDYIHPESGEKKYFCEHCDKGYIFEPTLYYHKWSRHNGDQKHMCDICGKEYNNKAGYTQHMLLQHNTNEAANLMCEQCAFSTPSKEMLKRHIKVIYKGVLRNVWTLGEWYNGLTYIRTNLHTLQTHSL